MAERAGVLVLVLLAVVPTSFQKPGVKVGSKKFTESVILAEIAAHLSENEGLEAEHVEGLGGTRQFEVAGKFGEFCGTKHSVLVPHGTDALKLGVQAPQYTRQALLSDCGGHLRQRQMCGRQCNA